jgi:hypothetical protein
MKARTIFSVPILTLLLVAVVISTRAQTSSPRPLKPQIGARTPSPQTKLKQYLADLQNTPENTALREKIIKLVQTMKPAPALPQEAQDELAKGSDSVKQATQPETTRDALAHFERAALLAPWWPDAYSNLASIQEKLEKLDDARASLSLYLLASPNATDAETVRNKIAALDPEERLKRSVAEVNSAPNDPAAREKVIRLAQTMKSPPAIPEEAREHYVMAAAFVEKAKDSNGFERAIEQYKAALLAAPWWADAYKKLAIAQKAADHYDDAIASLNLYLLTQPADSRDAQDEIYKLKADKQASAEDEARKQREEQQRQRQAAEEARAKAERARLESVEGRWCYLLFGTLQASGGGLMVIRPEAGGGWTIDYPNWSALYAYNIRHSGRSIAFTRMIRGADPSLNTAYLDLSLSSDGSELIGTIRTGNGTEPVTFVRQ